MTLRKYLMSFLALCVAVFGLTTLNISPASADVYDDKCFDHRTGDLTYQHSCVWAQFHNYSGPTGIRIGQLGAFVQGTQWAHPAAQCTGLIVKNDNGVIKYSKFSGCDIGGTGDPAGPFYPNGGDGIKMPNTAYATVTYIAYYDLCCGYPDIGTRTLTLTINS